MTIQRREPAVLRVVVDLPDGAVDGLCVNWRRDDDQWCGLVSYVLSDGRAATGWFPEHLISRAEPLATAAPVPVRDDVAEAFDAVLSRVLAKGMPDNVVG